MTLKRLDLWLREVWSFWDTHGSRLINIASTLYSAIAAILVAVYGADSTTAATLLAVGGAFGLVGRARSQNTAEIMAAKAPIVQPPETLR